MPKVADYIEKNREQIVQRYAEEVSKIPSARGTTFAEKIDTLPEFLETLAAISRAGKPDDAQQVALRMEETHLSLRLRLGYRLDEAIEEYVALSRIIAELWAQRPLAEQPEPQDVQLLTDQLQLMMDRAVEMFSGYSADEYQAEKRYLRRLDALSTQLLTDVPSADAVRTRLSPLLEVVQEAMQAGGTALFLVDESGQRLLPAGTSGLAAEPDEPVRLDQPSFLAQVAEADVPLYLSDASNADHMVSQPLCASGLRSLLGLRLYPHGKLLGVLYVGMDHVRLFEPRAKRYLQTLVGYLSGIVERTILTTQAQQARKRLQLLLDSVGEGIYGVDAEGRCTFANPACVKLLGYRSSDELIGKSMHHLIHHTKPNGKPYPIEECPLLSTARRGEPYHAEEELLWRADGTSFYADQRASPVYEEGRLMAAVITFTDVSARRQAEAEREALLAQSQRAVSGREEIVRIVSHDLRSPLAAILVASSLLMRDAAADEQGRRMRKQTALIQRSAERMHRLIDDLMDFGSIEAGALALKRAPHDPASLVREVAEEVREAAEDKGLTLEESLSSELPAVVCDRDRVLQVLANLLNNAIKVTQGGGTVTLAAQVQEDAVQFSVVDTGPGIAADELPHLFDRYWRGQSAGYKGAGLGLAIAKGIVEAHRGQIWAESELNVGSSFYFTIPRAED